MKKVNKLREIFDFLFFIKFRPSNLDKVIKKNKKQ